MYECSLKVASSLNMARTRMKWAGQMCRTYNHGSKLGLAAWP